MDAYGLSTSDVTPSTGGIDTTSQGVWGRPSNNDYDFCPDIGNLGIGVLPCTERIPGTTFPGEAVRDQGTRQTLCDACGVVTHFPRLAIPPPEVASPLHEEVVRRQTNDEEGYWSRRNQWQEAVAHTACAQDASSHDDGEIPGVFNMIMG